MFDFNVLNAVVYILAGIYLAGFMSPLFKNTLLDSGWWVAVLPGRELYVMRESSVVRTIFNTGKKIYFRNASDQGNRDSEYWRIASPRTFEVIVHDTDVACYTPTGPLPWLQWVINPLVIINWWLSVWGIVWVGALNLQTVAEYLYGRYKSEEEAKRKGQPITTVVELEEERFARVTDVSNHTRFFPFELPIMGINLETGDGGQVTVVISGRVIVFNSWLARFSGADPSWIGLIEKTFVSGMNDFILGARTVAIFPHILDPEGSNIIEPDKGFRAQLAEQLENRTNAFRRYGVVVSDLRIDKIIPSPETLAIITKIRDAFFKRKADQQIAIGNEALAGAPLKAVLAQLKAGLDPETARVTMLAQGDKGTTKIFLPQGAGSGGMVKAAAATIVAGDTTTTLTDTDTNGYPDTDALLAQMAPRTPRNGNGRKGK